MPVEGRSTLGGRNIIATKEVWAKLISPARSLVRDKLPLSRPKPTPKLALVSASRQSRAVNCTDDFDAVAPFLRNSLSNNTRRAYRADLDHFLLWGGAIPSTDRVVATYLAKHAGFLSVATLSRRVVAISRAHDAAGFETPTHSSLVRITMRGIKRTFGVAQKQAKPLLVEDLRRVVRTLGQRPKDLRDRALLLIGFAGAFRRSELVALNVEDIERTRQGLIVQIRRSKTDQIGAGRVIGIPFGSRGSCPVLALQRWLAVAKIEGGPLFRIVDRYGNILRQRLSGEAVSLVLRARVSEAGINSAGYSGHSLRVGFVTSELQRGATAWRVRRQTGHKSDGMLSRYARFDPFSPID